MKNWFLILVICGGILSCRDEVVLPEYSYELAIPPHFPSMEIPEDNPLTNEKVKLGKLLFEDVQLSRNSTVSCASCHFPSSAMGDTVAFSIGLNGESMLRNSVALFNMGYHPYFFRDGGAPSLEIQVIAPLENPLEMDMTVVEVCDRLNEDPIYVKLAKDAFGTEVTPFVVSRSLSSYIRTLISGASAFDAYVNGDTQALTAQELEGYDLFLGKAGCINCHSGFDFTDYSFQNNGWYEVYADSGRQRITLDPLDQGKFKVLSLRNLSFTAPYMHDGSVNDLYEIIENYNQGGKGHWNQSGYIQPLNLTLEEMESLHAFLLTLNDYEFIQK